MAFGHAQRHPPAYGGARQSLVASGQASYIMLSYLDKNVVPAHSPMPDPLLCTERPLQQRPLIEQPHPARENQFVVPKLCKNLGHQFFSYTRSRNPRQANNDGDSRPVLTCW